MEVDRAVWGLAGVVVGFMLTTIKDWWKHKATLQNDRYYLSILTVSKLDKFFEMSCSVASDSGRQSSDGCHYAYTVLPTFEPESIDVEWRCLPKGLMFDLLDFPTQIEAANNMIKGASEHWATPPYFEEFFEERQYQYAALGLKALDLAKRLRKVSYLPAHECGDEYNHSITRLRTVMSDIEAKRERQRLFHLEIASMSKQHKVNTTG